MTIALERIIYIWMWIPSARAKFPFSKAAVLGATVVIAAMLANHIAPPKGGDTAAASPRTRAANTRRLAAGERLVAADIGYSK